MMCLTPDPDLLALCVCSPRTFSVQHSGQTTGQPSAHGWPPSISTWLLQQATGASEALASRPRSALARSWADGFLVPPLLKRKSNELRPGPCTRARGS